LSYLSTANSLWIGRSTSEYSSGRLRFAPSLSYSFRFTCISDS
jgi:hypothetical protein